MPGIGQEDLQKDTATGLAQCGKSLLYFGVSSGIQSNSTLEEIRRDSGLQLKDEKTRGFSTLTCERLGISMKFLGSS